jgi:hypothetical protein
MFAEEEDENEERRPRPKILRYSVVSSKSATEPRAGLFGEAVVTP